jgi:succinyl-CoA synthetase alpha subunit
MSDSVLTNVVRRGFYLDSVALMRLSSELAASDGVEDGVLMMGTPANKQIMSDAGLLADASGDAGANDLIIALRTADESIARSLLDLVGERLDTHTEREVSKGGHRHRTLASAVDEMRDANLALISVPGEFAAREARKALACDLNVMIFSDNVPLEEEVALKKEADARGLLVMGPDCGTAILAGVPIAFANAVRRGSVGIVSASGTGLQEISVLLDRLGAGVSHGIGVGGRDLSDRVGGLTTLQSIDLLAADPRTEHIVLISKPPGPDTAEKVFARLADCRKPASVCMFGLAASAPPANVTVSSTLKTVAESAAGRTLDDGPRDVAAPTASSNAARKWVHGLYSGGTLCAEAQAIFHAAGVATRSNVPLAESPEPTGAGHRMIDLGADEYTRGRPHPMIEPSVRVAELAASLSDPNVAVVLLDVMLGFGAHPDPCASIVEAISNAPEDRPIVVCSVCGTDADPQSRTDQVGKLEQAGVLVASSNADAAELSLGCIAG